MTPAIGQMLRTKQAAWLDPVREKMLGFVTHEFWVPFATSLLVGSFHAAPHSGQMVQPSGSAAFVSGYRHAPHSLWL